YNEGGRWLLDRMAPERCTKIANTQIALDTLALITVLHFDGGLASQGLLLLGAAFFIYGAALPLTDALCHVGGTTFALTLLAFAERSGVLAHLGSDFFVADVHARGDFLTPRIVLVSVVNALSVAMSHQLSGLLRERAERGRELAAERGALVANYEREAMRVRLLLDVAQRASATPSMKDVLGAVCDATLALGCATRVETFVWEAGEKCLRLIAARGVSCEGL